VTGSSSRQGAIEYNDERIAASWSGKSAEFGHMFPQKNRILRMERSGAVEKRKPRKDDFQ
jgi:hypothetical protein